jgi:drug/metabolite transporter (DMT)-like permease
MALGCALLGAYLVITKGAALSVFATDTFAGDLLALLAAGSFGAYLLLTRRWQNRLGLTSEEITLYTFLLSLPVLALLALADGGFWGELTLRSGASLLWLGVACSTVAFLALNRALAAGAVTRTSLHIMASPVVAALISWPLFGLVLTPVQVLGGLLVLLGIALAQR